MKRLLSFYVGKGGVCGVKCCYIILIVMFGFTPMLFEGSALLELDELDLL